MIRFFASHPTAANLLMAGFLALGVLGLPQLKRETFPEIPARHVEVRALYPGASAADVEAAVCRRIEDALDGVNFVREVVAEARENLAIVTVEMEAGGDFRVFLDDIRSEVEAIDDFPALVEEPVVRDLGRTDQVVSLAVTADLPPAGLKAYCLELEDRLRQSGISSVELTGFGDHHLRVELSDAALRAHGLSVAQVAAAIGAESVDLPAGTVETGARDLLLRFADERRTAGALGELVVVGGRTGAEVRLRDLGTVEDRFERDEEKIVFNGRRAGVLAVSKTRSEDTLTVFAAVERFLEREASVRPPGVEFALTQDAASIVEDRLSMLVRNGWQGLALVFLVMALFFNLRYSFWVVMGLPVSFLGALFFLPHAGASINMITMVGMLLGTGLLMDDAIVITENIAAHRRRGKSGLDAAVAGVREVLPGVVASFATTVCVFGPLLFLQGDLGVILAAMQVVLLLVLAVSLVEAFLILPRHLAHARDEPGRFRARFDAGLDRFRERVFGPLVDWAVRWRYLALGLTVLAFLLAISLVAGGAVKFRAFPDIDGDVLEARILLPQGTPLARTEEVVARVTGALARVDQSFAPRQPDGQSLVRNRQVRFGFNRDAHESGPHVATVIVDLLAAETRDAAIDDITRAWREEVGRVADVLSLEFAEPALGPAGRPIEIRLFGAPIETLKARALEIQTWLLRFRGVTNLSDDLRPGKPELRVRVRPGGRSLGLTGREIATQLRAAFHGVTASEIQVGAESYEVDVRLRHADADSLADVEAFGIVLPGGARVPLRTVATIEEGRGYARIGRVDGRRTVTIAGDLDGRLANTGEVLGAFEKEFAGRLDDVRYSLEGEARESATTGASLRRAFLTGLIGIFLLLSFQFRSYVEPLVVMIAIPFALIGVIAGHWLMGLELTMPSMVGFVSLAGVVVNDSILLVEFVKMRRAEGQTTAEAASTASRQRFRAVLLTSLTTIAGLLPLLTERSLQAQILVPLATSIVFGLLASTFLVLLMVPAAYTIVSDFTRNPR